VLRDEWGFKGFVLSDMGAIWRLYDSHHTAATPEDAVCQAINAGVDMQLYDFPSDVFQNSILQGLKDGKLDPTALDRAVSDVLRAKFMLGLFDRPVDPSVEAKVGRSPEHLELTLRSARESMCLLRNEGHLLPLSKDVKTLAVLGPYADVARLGDYSDKIKGKFPSMLAEIRKLVPTANVLYDAGKDIPAAVSKAQQADVVIMGLGEGPGESGERCDVTSLDLPGKQEQLLEAVAATGKPVVLVLQNGRPLTITWAAAHIPAILEAWYPGERGGQAITETLFGDNNPGGRLPVSFPRSLGQLPIFYNYAISSRSGYIDGSNKPLFSFGYGLSYTTFAYSDMQATPPAAGSKDDVMVSARVTNTGKVEGDEVAQLYLREDISSVVMPVKSLKGFQRIHLKPGEAQTVVFHVPQEQLAVWNPMQKWAIEPGAYTVWVGGQSDGIQSTHFTLP
jgi:beta-glucosidase